MYLNTVWMYMFKVRSETHVIITWHWEVHGSDRVEPSFFPLFSFSGCERCPPAGRASTLFLESVLTAARYVCVPKCCLHEGLRCTDVQHTPYIVLWEAFECSACCFYWSDGVNKVCDTTCLNACVRKTFRHVCEWEVRATITWSFICQD